MKSTSRLIGVLLLFAGACFAQTYPGNYQQNSVLHRVGGVFYSTAYSQWQAVVISGNTTTGSGTSIIVSSNGAGGAINLTDGTPVSLATVFNTSTPVTINDANAETFTPSGVSIGACPAGNLGVGGSSTCATVTGTIANTHGQGALVNSGDLGIEEAITDAGNQGGGSVFWMVDTGIVTLNTGGLTTTTTTKIPTTFTNMGASARVTTTITTSTNWAVGISGTTSAFCTANATLTAGTTCLANQVSPVSVGTTQSLTAILITVTGANAGAGAVKVRLWGYTTVQASS
jgi:hypothetical protein